MAGMPEILTGLLESFDSLDKDFSIDHDKDEDDGKDEDGDEKIAIVSAALVFLGEQLTFHE
jgi:hypothetical protein